MPFKKIMDLPNGPQVRMIITRDTEEIMSERHTRGRSLRVAGNFDRWSNIAEILDDTTVWNSFAKHVGDIVREKDSGIQSITINYGAPVGWANVAPTSLYSTRNIEEFQPNKRAYGLRVKLDRVNLPAPRTSDLVIVTHFRRDGKNFNAVVYAIFPGKDIGIIKGHVSKREKVVFFDWNHPGEV
jgi:hypothetical protein